MSINFGRYDQEIVIQSYTETKSANGGVVRSYSTYASVWAQVLPKGGNEAQEAKEKTARRICDFNVRKDGLTLNETMRIVWDGETFDITTIDRAGNRLNEYYMIRGLSKDN
jgi:SPP1 family predicted phage head-tail adaptor